jgi:hypothetical protein
VSPGVVALATVVHPQADVLACWMVWIDNSPRYWGFAVILAPGLLLATLLVQPNRKREEITSGQSLLPRFTRWSRKPMACHA